MLLLALNAIVLVLDAIPTMVFSVIVVMMDFSFLERNVKLVNQPVLSALLQLSVTSAKATSLPSKHLFSRQVKLELCPRLCYSNPSLVSLVNLLVLLALIQ